MPVTNKVLVNREEVKNLIQRSISTSFTLKSNNISVLIYYFDGKITSHDNSALGRYIKNILLDDFLFYISSTGFFTSLSHRVSDNQLSSMVFWLEQHGLATVVQTEYNRENEYKISNRKVMRSRRHSTDWNSSIEPGCRELICEKYDKLKNGDQANIANIEGSIDFIYV